MEAQRLIEASWREGTRRKYDAQLKKWKAFCVTRSVDWLSPPIGVCVDFLADLHTRGLSYSSVNTARSALSAVIGSIDGCTLGEHALVRRLMKGVFTSRPPKPRLSCVWDASIVLNYLRKQKPAAELQLRDLSMFLVTLLLLLTGQRCQTLAQLSAHDIDITGNVARIKILGLLKSSRPGHHVHEVVVKGFPEEPTLCVVSLLSAYLHVTRGLRPSEPPRLFISHAPPHRPIGPSTIGRWTKEVLQGAGVKGFSAHSTRAAATSAAKESLPVDHIVACVGWASEKTFAVYYDKPIVALPTIGDAVLGRLARPEAGS